MKFDLHCHTKEGSFDSKVPVETLARRFKILGYDGFMIADHNSYRGCKAWDNIEDKSEFEGLTVIRGLEYDTKDAGHILVVMPDDLYLPIFKSRGMKCKRLIYFVHLFGGVCGPAHPYGARASSMMSLGKLNPKILRNMDFIETFNTCEQPSSNEMAVHLAKKYRLPGIGGSDAHKPRYIGMAFTDIHHHIRCNNDFIHAIKCHATTETGGTERVQTKKAKYKENWLGVTAYRLYNRGLAKVTIPRRGIHHARIRKKRKRARSYVPERPKDHSNGSHSDV